MLYKDILGTIGGTPVIELERLVKKLGLDGKIYAKIEFYSPGLSKKDRVAKYIIEQAEANGTLKEGQTVIEQTSGNTGIGAAAVCAVKGYPFIAVMSEGNSPERIMMIKQFGAKVELVKQAEDSVKGKVSAADMALVEQRFNELAAKLGAFKVGQFYNPDNANSHFHSTGKEILADIPHVEAFVDFIGTGGSFEGIASALKKADVNKKCFIVEPEKAQHIIQGGGYFKTPPFAIRDNCDGVIKVSDSDAMSFMTQLSSVEAISGGISSGANLAAAVKYLEENPGSSVVFLVNDPALKYMSVLSLT